jgi:hypothetical protein
MKPPPLSVPARRTGGSVRAPPLPAASAAAPSRWAAADRRPTSSLSAAPELPVPLSATPLLLPAAVPPPEDAAAAPSSPPPPPLPVAGAGRLRRCEEARRWEAAEEPSSAEASSSRSGAAGE